ncbi:MAG: hypothetical protein MJK18_01000, partial [Bdellovibrionales bacterium]|nr:hypothetical protein [Bdellovibrionales bacterium]
KELFGQATRGADGKTFNNGFDALIDLDSNKDALITAEDKAYGELKLWFDLNADGVSQMNELRTLADLDVKKISLEYKKMDEDKVMNRGNKVLLSSTFYGPQVCGEKGCKVFDIFFNNLEVSTELASK